MKFHSIIAPALALLLTAGSSFAQDPDVLRQYIKDNYNAENFAEVWLHRNQSEFVRKPEIKLWADGQILIDRTNPQGVRKTYEVKITHVALANFDTKFTLKSTTCPNVKTSLSCKAHVRYPGVRAVIQPLGEKAAEPDGRAFTLDLDGLGKKYFPELERAARFELTCNAWDWIEPDSKNIEIVEIGSIDDNQQRDLAVTNKRATFSSANKTCPSAKGFCDLRSDDSGTGIDVFGETTFYLEVKNQDQACTLEFQGGTRPDLLDYFTKEMARPYPPLSSPKFIASLQKRITPELVEAWVRQKISGEKSLDAEQAGIGELYTLINYSLFKFLEVVDSNGFSIGEKPFKIFIGDRFEDQVQ